MPSQSPFNIRRRVARFNDRFHRRAPALAGSATVGSDRATTPSRSADRRLSATSTLAAVEEHLVAGYYLRPANVTPERYWSEPTVRTVARHIGSEDGRIYTGDLYWASPPYRALPSDVPGNRRELFLEYYRIGYRDVVQERLRTFHAAQNTMHLADSRTSRPPHTAALGSAARRSRSTFTARTAYSTDGGTSRPT